MQQIHLPARLDQLETVNAFLTANTPKAFASILPTLELVAEELLVNVFSYAYPEGTSGDAELSLKEVFFDDQDMLCFSVRDWGAPFNPFASAPAPDLSSDTESRPVGGLGIYIITQVTRHHAYTYDERSNIIEVYLSLGEQNK